MKLMTGIFAFKSGDRVLVVEVQHKGSLPGGGDFLNEFAVLLAKKLGLQLQLKLGDVIQVLMPREENHFAGRIFA